MFVRDFVTESLQAGNMAHWVKVLATGLIHGTFSIERLRLKDCHMFQANMSYMVSGLVSVNKLTAVRTGTEEPTRGLGCSQTPQ